MEPGFCCQAFPLGIEPATFQVGHTEPYKTSLSDVLTHASAEGRNAALEAGLPVEKEVHKFLTRDDPIPDTVLIH